MGVSGPGVVYAAIADMKGANLGEIAEQIKKTAFHITRMGELVAREASRRLGAEFGIVDLSLAPTPAQGDSVARILEAMGLETCGGCGTDVYKRQHQESAWSSARFAGWFVRKMRSHMQNFPAVAAREMCIRDRSKLLRRKGEKKQ